MKETLQHKEAFEYYYSLGENRGYREVAQKFNTSLTTLAKWGKTFNWQERVTQRDIEISKQLEKKTNTTVLNEKANYRKLIKEAITNMNDIKIESVKDYETLVKLDLLLMGESTEKSDNTISIKLEGELGEWAK